MEILSVASRSMPAMRRRVSCLATALLGVGLALFSFEVWVRCVHPEVRDQVMPGGLLRMDGDLGWRLTPNAEGVHRSTHFTVTYVTNSLGFRDEPRTVARAAGVSRTLLFGDSEIFGWGVPTSERFSNRMENDHRQIWNLAVPGYGLDQEIFSYRRDGRGFDADEVIFYVSHLTLERLRASYIFRKYKPRFSLNANGDLTLEPVPKVGVGLTDFLYRALSPFYLPYFLERRFADPLTPVPPGTFEFGKLAKRLLLEARAAATQAGERIAVLSDLPPPQRSRVRDFCSRNGIGFLEIALENRSGLLVISSDDTHWNAEAHAVIAEQLSGQLEAEPTGLPTAYH
jgi:hypothetical protein